MGNKNVPQQKPATATAQKPATTQAVKPTVAPAKTAVTPAAEATAPAVVKPTEKPKRVIVKLKTFTTEQPIAEELQDFDFGQFKPLKKNDFAKVSLYFLHRAAEMEFKAERFRKEAEESSKFGSAKEVKAAKRLVKMTEKIATLKETLVAQGVNVEELLKQLLVAAPATK